MAPRPLYLLRTAALALPLMFTVGGCNTQQYDVETTSPANAGQVQIVLSVDKTGNGKITMHFEHMPPPKRVDKSLRAYVVWGTSDGKDPYKLGIVDYDESKRTGSLEATYSDDRMTIIVTLEQDPNTNTPIGARVLEQVVVAPRKK